MCALSSPAKKKRILDQFEQALSTCDGDDRSIARVQKLLPAIDEAFIWPQAMRRVASLTSELNPHLRLSFYRVFTHHGDHLKQETGNDLLFIRALRKLLPIYRGGGMTLYRGETFGNRRHRTYGVFWSASKGIAEDFASDPFRRRAKGGSVLLRAEVPQDAIIAKLFKGYDPYEEQEFYVDRRKLKPGSVHVLKSWPQLEHYPSVQEFEHWFKAA